MYFIDILLFFIVAFKPVRMVSNDTVIVELDIAIPREEYEEMMKR